jgi:hypothetical protein
MQVRFIDIDLIIGKRIQLVFHCAPARYGQSETGRIRAFTGGRHDQIVIEKRPLVGKDDQYKEDAVVSLCQYMIAQVIRWK